jgi:PRTRC genetic system ThiF family protein
MIHYTDKYILNPTHRVTVDVAGIGGTGIQVLTNLARMNIALQGLGHPGLFIRAWDMDEVTEANMGRQLFSPADINVNKATAAITRINRFFGTDWESINKMYDGKESFNIVITCVDTAKARIKIGENLLKMKASKNPTEDTYYWLDIGNLQNTGQCILGTLLSAYPPVKMKGHKSNLKTVIQKFPQLKTIKEENQGPSCSLAESLEKQDLFINSILAQFGCNIIWKLIKEQKIAFHGCYVNLATLSVNPIKV